MCNNCGYPLQGNEQVCPECGNIIEQPQPVYEPQPQQAAAQPTDPMPVYVVATPPKTDWANYIYECSVIVWRVITKLHQMGRPCLASRILVVLGFLDVFQHVLLLYILCVCHSDALRLDPSTPRHQPLRMVVSRSLRMSSDVSEKIRRRPQRIRIPRTRFRYLE